MHMKTLYHLLFTVFIWEIGRLPNEANRAKFDTLSVQG